MADTRSSSNKGLVQLGDDGSQEKQNFKMSTDTPAPLQTADQELENALAAEYEKETERLERAGIDHTKEAGATQQGVAYKPEEGQSQFEGGRTGIQDVYQMPQKH